MKINHTPGTENGTVLIISMTTITILTLICATSLYVMSQNANSGMQTASWQQALSGAESAIDRGIVALNTNSWTGWKMVTSTSLPTTKPSGGTSVSCPPATPCTPPNNSCAPCSGSYYYMILPTVISQGEGNNTVSSWVILDTAGAGLQRTVTLTL
jgi:Tfp pilus assembly protein PilX